MSVNQTKTTTTTPLHEFTFRLRDQYRELNSIIDQILGDSSQSQYRSGVETVREKMAEITVTESKLRPLRDGYLSHHDGFPRELAEPTDETVSLLEGLVPKITQLEKIAQDQAQQLKPQVMSSVRATQMQNAYRTHSQR